MNLSTIQGGLLLDDYDRKARLLPGLLAILPLILTMLAMFPMANAYATVAGIVVLFGGPMVLAEWVRIYGQKQETILFPVMPTTALLRHSDKTINPVTKRRYHQILQKNLPDIKLPTAKQELANPEESDCQYESAVCWLKEATRNHDEYPLVFREVMHYGFLLNLLGIKPLGLAFAVIGAITNAAVLYKAPSPALASVGLGVSLSMNFMWLIYVTRPTVIAAGKDYAKILLAACDRLPKD